jgi:large subunit ribosomal protein L6
MSRIGKQHIVIPDKVKVELEGQKIIITGPKGDLSRILPPFICCKLDLTENKLFVEKVEQTKLAQSLHGLSRTLLANMIIGVSSGFEKKLEISGVGYRAQMSGKNLVLNMGYSHPITMVPPSNLSINVPSPTNITVSGIDKEIVGEFAAKIRSVRPPEPYKGKGIIFEGEFVRRKAGKAGKK